MGVGSVSNSVDGGIGSNDGGDGTVMIVAKLVVWLMMSCRGGNAVSDMILILANKTVFCRFHRISLTEPDLV